MNRLLLLAIAGLSLMGCASSDEPTPAHLEPTATHHEANLFRRTPEEAMDAVQSFLIENSELRSGEASRAIEGLVDLAQLSEFRSTAEMSDFADKFYAVQLKDNQGYAFVSKDLRTFPLFALLDSGHVGDGVFRSSQMQMQRAHMLAGFDAEVARFDTALQESQNELRGNNDKGYLNTERAIEEFKADGWSLERSTGPRLSTTWGQRLDNPSLYMNSDGARYADVYGGDQARSLNWLPASTGGVFGCTPVAFGQVMYALRHEAGFRDLKYTSGESVLWDRMTPYRSHENQECMRFLGWITMNCDPINIDGETMVFNINATKFLRGRLGDYIISRYDNCVVSEGDFDGYGWSEDRRIADEFFEYPKCFVIMTASAGTLDFSYHTFVIDGMAEFKKRIKGSGFLGTGIFRRTRDGIRHLYHVNAGWDGASNGYYLYVQNVNDEFRYTGTNNAMDYRSKVAYLIVRPK